MSHPLTESSVRKFVILIIPAQRKNLAVASLSFINDAACGAAVNKGIVVRPAIQKQHGIHKRQNFIPVRNVRGDRTGIWASFRILVQVKQHHNGNL